MIEPPIDERYFIEWPDYEEWQREAYLTPRDAIDAARLAAAQQQSGGA